MMRDCPNATVRERLPDLIHDRLPAAARAEVLSHLETCADCRAELQLIERARAVAVAPAVDTRRIVSALPAYRAVPQWRRAAGSPLLRVAAAVVLLIGGAMVFRDAPVRFNEPAAIPPGAAVSETPLPKGATTQVAVRPVAPTAATTELAVGEMFHDLTDSELRALLDALGTLEAVTPIETEVVAPAVGRGAGDA